LTGTTTGLKIGDATGTLQVVNNGNFWTQIAIPDPLPTKPVSTLFGDGCTEDSASGIISCTGKEGEGKSTQGQYV